MHGMPSVAFVTQQPHSGRRRWMTAAASLLISACGGGGGGPPAPIIPVVVSPSIVTQPAVVSVTVGQPAAFTVTAGGTAPLTYQRQRGGADIVGAMTTTFTLSTTVLADNGPSFPVVERNSAGTLVSDAAILTVNPPPVAPSITAQPSRGRVFARAVVTFTANFTGTPFPTAQWQLSTDNDAT